MSDCKTIYKKVNEFVKCLYPNELRGNLQPKYEHADSHDHRYHYRQGNTAA